MIDTPYVEVAVTLPVYHAFTYSLPDHLHSQARIGARVLVPFGRRRVTGFILKGKDSDGGYKTKHILDVLDAVPLFPESMVEWFQWISAYYIHPLGEVIKAALPSGLDRHDVSHVSLGPGVGQLETSDLPPGQQQIITHLKNRESMTLKQLSKALDNPSIHSLIKKMERQGLLEVTTLMESDKVRVKLSKFLELKSYPDSGVRLSKKRRQILDRIQERPGISLDQLRKEIPTAPRLITPLAKDGYVRVIEKQVFRDPLGDPVDPDSPPELTEEQAAAVDRVIGQMDQGFKPYLLYGVTGSGKTEVYLRLTAHVLAQGKKAIVLVPEISLISQTERRFRARFQNRVAVIHSGLTKAELLDQWYKMLYNKADVVVGARSCIFAPMDPLGIVIVDEEHDTSYKQESGLRYNARDMAVVRAKLEQVPAVLGSATPSVQSYHNAALERFERLTLGSRVNRYPLPGIQSVDLRNYKDQPPNQKLITPELSDAIRTCLNKGEQALIFLNRRGFASFPVCGACGQSVDCRQCQITMTYHKGAGELRCHLCGLVQPFSKVCPACGEAKVKTLGFGTEKIENLLKQKFPDARLARIDQDTTARRGQMVKLLKSIKNRTVDIIVGTQMLAKGHDFPSITLVGIVCADLALSLPDFRASERTFQVLAQVAGRAGRGAAPGKVIMQTYNPEHFSMEAARQQDYDRFFQEEIPFRKALGYPPFSRVVLIKISSTGDHKAEQVAAVLGDLLTAQIGSDGEAASPIRMLGPAKAPISKIASRYRWQIILTGQSVTGLNRLVVSVVGGGKLNMPKDVKLAVDVDPYSLM
ncbi:MAG: primosomal protein N' [Desulfobacteraceae bacterium]|nr:MAG: primosomal protein N' [Desulfobacteraceae bacterium]